MEKYIIDFDPKVCVQQSENFIPRYILLNPLDYLQGNDLIIPDGIRMPNGEIVYDFWFDNLEVIKSFSNHSGSIDMYIGDNLLHAFKNYKMGAVSWNNIEGFLYIPGLKNIYFHDGNVLKGEFCELRSENGIIYCSEDQQLVPPLNTYAQERPLLEKDRDLYSISEKNTVEGIKDMFGGLYSCDGKKFIKWLGATQIVSYKIKDGVEEICDDAFNVTTGVGMGIMGLYIDNILIPEGVKRIGDRAFLGANLKSIELPTSLESIGVCAFVASMHSHGLDSIYIPENVKYIGEYCFNNNINISEIHVAPENKWYCSEDNALYNKGKTELIKVAEIRKLAPGEIINTSDDYYIPSYFDGYTARREFVILESVEIIKSGAFHFCFIKRLIIHDNIRILEENAIETGYEYLYIGKNIRQISEDFFRFTHCLKEIEVSPENQWFCVEDGVLYNADKTKLLFCPRNKKVVNIPATVGIIGHSAFAGCHIEKLTLPPSVSMLGSYSFHGSNLSEISLSYNLCSVGTDVLAACYKLRKIKIPGGTEMKYRMGHRCKLAIDPDCQCFEGFFVDDSLPKAELTFLPKIEELYTDDHDMNVYYIPSGTFDYYESKTADDDEWYGEFVEISKEMVISHLNDLKEILCTILTQKHNLECYKLKKSVIDSEESAMDVISLRSDDYYWLFFHYPNYVAVGSSYGCLGDILLLLGFDYDEFLRSKDNVTEYKINDKDFACCIGKVLAKTVKVEWPSELVDEDTGETISIKMGEQIALYGSYIDEDTIKTLSEKDGIESIFVYNDYNEYSDYNYDVLDSRVVNTPEEVLQYYYAMLFDDTYPTDIDYPEVLQKVLHEMFPNCSEMPISESTVKRLKEDLINIGLELSVRYFYGDIDSSMSCMQEKKSFERNDDMINIVKDCIIDFFDKEVNRFSKMNNTEVYQNLMADESLKLLLEEEIDKCEISASLKRRIKRVISLID